MALCPGTAHVSVSLWRESGNKHDVYLSTSAEMRDSSVSFRVKMDSVNVFADSKFFLCWCCGWSPADIGLQRLRPLSIF